MPLTQEKRIDSNFANNNDNSYLHKKFKKMASTISILPANGETRQRDSNVQSSYDSSIPNGSIAAAHPEIEKIKERHKVEFHNLEKNVQTSYNDENCRISNVNNFVKESGQTSYTDEFSNKTENLENDLVKDAYNGGTGGRYVCVYCKLSCAKPSVLQKHIRAHTNERPYPCVPCGFAFKTKSNLYKHRRSRTHALRLQGTDVSAATFNEEDLSGGSESDTSIPPASVSDAGSDASAMRIENRPNEFSSPELMNDNISPSINAILASGENNRSKGIYKPKFRAAFYQENDDKDKTKKNISYGDYLTEHISKIISDNEAIIDVIETPLQKKYNKIKQIAESKQFQNDTNELKLESSPLNLTKNNETDNSFRKRSHSESFSQFDYKKHPLNPEGSIIKNLLLKNKANGMTAVQNENTDSIEPLFVCPLCQIIYRSADNLEIHRLYYCKGASNNSITTKELKVGRPENVFIRSNSINVRLPETQSNSKANAPNKTLPLKVKPDNLVITKPESNVAAPLPSPGPLLGNTRLVDTRTDSRKMDCSKIKHTLSPKRKIDNRSETYSPRLSENMSPLCTDVLYPQPKMRCIETNTHVLRPLDDLSPHVRHNSLQMFGGEVKIVHHSGSTTTLRIEPSKNQLSPILIHQNLSPTKLGNDSISNIVVRSGLHSGGTIVHNPPTPKEILTTPKPQTPRITISTAPVISNTKMPNMHDMPHFQFPPLSAITAFNPLTLPPLSPSPTPNGPTTILHGGKLIPHVPGIPGPNTPGGYIGTSQGQTKNINSDYKTDSNYSMFTKTTSAAKYESTRSSKSPNLRTSHTDLDKTNLAGLRTESHHNSMSAPSLTIKPKIVAEPQLISKTFTPSIIKASTGLKRNSDGLPRTPIVKENQNHYHSPIKVKEKYNNKSSDVKLEKEVRHFNFESLITKTEIFNNQIPSSSDVQKNTNAQESLPSVSLQNERSETFYFQKSSSTKSGNEDRKPKFLRPSTLPLKIGTFTPKRHHGITPNANTMPLVSPETPRPAKAYGQLYLNGNAYTYLGLKCSTKVFYCTINRPQPTYVPNQHFLSMYSNWQLLSELTPDPLGLSASSAMSLYDSRHRPQTLTIAVIKQDLILTHSSQWNKNSKDNKQLLSTLDLMSLEDNKLPNSDSLTTKKELAGGFESNEEYTYVRGRGRGRYVCSECGIRCKKPSMLKKHIRTHTDVRPYTCIHCAFSFKTKGNLTKHMKSKAHYKKCCELGINPNEGTEGDVGEMTQCSGETDDDTESDGDEGNEGETESSDTEAYKSRLPEHEAAHCLLSLGGSRPSTSANPGLITSARPTTYPYTPTGLETTTLELNNDMPIMTRRSSADSKSDADNEPMDLSRNDAKAITPNIPEILTARESSVLASLASNTAKLPQHQTQWTNGEPMLHTYLTERALLDTKIKQSQLTSNLSKPRKIDLEKSTFTDHVPKNITSTSSVTMTTSVVTTLTITSQIVSTKAATVNSAESVVKPPPSSHDEIISDVTEPPMQVNSETDLKRVRTSSNTNAENAKHVVSEYLKHAKINQIKTYEENPSNQAGDDSHGSQYNVDDNTMDDSDMTDSESVKLPTEHDAVARKVVIGVGGVAFKVTKGKEFEGSSSFPPGRLMEDGRRVCDFCNKTFTKPSQLRLHLNIHYMERPFRCSVCAVSFRTRGHLQKHERSGSHHNKVSMTSTFGTATSFNPRPFRCSDCNIAFRIHGHLAKHLRSKMHVMRLECLFKLPFGTFTEIERAGVSLTDIDTTDCASSLTSLQNLARKLHEKDPTSLEYREPSNAVSVPACRESSEDEDGAPLTDRKSESEKDSETKTNENSEVQNVKTQVNFSATDI